MSTSGSETRTRLSGIDAARGMAMFFSCLSHFGWWIEPRFPAATGILTDIGKIATPTFLLLSGAMTGWIISSGYSSAEARFKLLNRGIFLVTIAHILISLSEIHGSERFMSTVVTSTITDDIGLGMLVCALAIGWLRDPQVRRRLLHLGLCGFLLCWLTVLTWHPQSHTAILFRQVMLGFDPMGTVLPAVYESPLLQNLCMFAVGIGASEYLISAANPSLATGSINARRLIHTGAILTVGAAAARLGLLMIDRAFGDYPLEAVINLTAAVTVKTPPSPAYFAFFGGVGLILTGALALLSHRQTRVSRVLVFAFGTVGRASLFVFVLQYFVFWSLPSLLGWTPNRYSAVLFAVDLPAIWLAARLWNTYRGNRLLTVGLKPRPGPGQKTDRVGPQPGAC